MLEPQRALRKRWFLERAAKGLSRRDRDSMAFRGKTIDAQIMPSCGGWRNRGWEAKLLPDGGSCTTSPTTQSEKNDLAPKMPDKAKTLDAQLSQWLADVGAKLPKPTEQWRCPSSAPSTFDFGVGVPRFSTLTKNQSSHNRPRRRP